MAGSAGAVSVLLDNASGSGGGVQWAGGAALWMIEGTFGGATAQLQFQTRRGTWISMPSDLSATNNKVWGAYLPQGVYRVTLTGGSPSAMYSELIRVGI